MRQPLWPNTSDRFFFLIYFCMEGDREICTFMRNSSVSVRSNWIIRVCWGWLKKADVTACPLLVGGFQFSTTLRRPSTSLPPLPILDSPNNQKIINSCSCPSLFFMDLRSSLFFQMPTQSQRWLIPGLGMRLTLWWWKERAPVSTSTTCWDRRWDKKQSNRAQVSHWSGRRRSPHFVIFHTLTGRRYQFHF